MANCAKLIDGGTKEQKIVYGNEFSNEYYDERITFVCCGKTADGSECGCPMIVCASPTVEGHVYFRGMEHKPGCEFSKTRHSTAAVAIHAETTDLQKMIDKREKPELAARPETQKVQSEAQSVAATEQDEMIVFTTSNRSARNVKEIYECFVDRNDSHIRLSNGKTVNDVITYSWNVKEHRDKDISGHHVLPLQKCKPKEEIGYTPWRTELVFKEAFASPNTRNPIYIIATFENDAVRSKIIKQIVAHNANPETEDNERHFIILGKLRRVTKDRNIYRCYVNNFKCFQFITRDRIDNSRR